MGDVSLPADRKPHLSPKEGMERGRGRTMTIFPLKDSRQTGDNFSNIHIRCSISIFKNMPCHTHMHVIFQKPTLKEASRLNEGKELACHVDHNRRNAGWAAFLKRKFKTKGRAHFIKPSDQFLQDITICLNLTSEFQNIWGRGKTR